MAGEWKEGHIPLNGEWKEGHIEAAQSVQPATTPRKKSSTPIADYFTTPPDRPASLKDFVTKNVPRSAANTLYGIASALPITAPFVQAHDIATGGPRTQSALSDLKNLKLSDIPGKILENAKGLAKSIAAPFGLADSGKFITNAAKGGPLYAAYRAATQPGETPLGETGGEEFADAWTRQPVQSALAVAPMAVAAGGKVVSGARGLKDIRNLPENIIKRGAANRLNESITKTGPVSKQSAINAVETEILKKKMPGWDVGMGQATDDPQLLALQRRIGMNDDSAKAYTDALRMGNNQALRSYLDKSLPGEGGIDDVLTVLERATKGARAATVSRSGAATRQLESLPGQSKEAAGGVLRKSAETVRDTLRAKSAKLYEKVPENAELDSTPIYSGIEREFSANDPAFSKINMQLNSVLRRAKGALEPEPSLILGPDGLPAITTEGPASITVGQVKNFRSQVTSNLRAAQKEGNADLARRYRNILDDIEKTEDLAIQNGMGEGIDALREARSFYRDVYVPIVRRGGTAEVLAKEGTGGMRVDPAMVGKSYFQPGDKGVEAANSFVRTFGNDDVARGAIKDYAANDLLTYAQNPLTGKIEVGKVSRWMARHKDALDRLNLGDEFKTVKSAAEAAEAARAAETQLAQSRFGKVLGTDPKKAMQYLFGGENARKTALTMKELLKMTDGDNLARVGLKRSFADMLIKNAEMHSKDNAGIRNIGQAKLEGSLDAYQPAMRILYSNEELNALHNVHRAIDIASRINRSVSGVAGSQSADLITGKAMAGGIVRNYLPLNSSFRILRAVFNGLKSGYDAQVNEYISRAIYDPQVAKVLVDVMKLAKSKGTKAATAQLSEKAAISATASGAISSPLEPE
jgi:hypothetical protein